MRRSMPTPPSSASDSRPAARARPPTARRLESAWSASSQLALVALHLVLGDPEADERAGQAAHGGADGRPAERRQDGSRGDERADAGNGQRADASEPSERAADDTAGGRTRRSAFRRLRVL